MWCVVLWLTSTGQKNTCMQLIFLCAVRQTCHVIRLCWRPTVRLTSEQSASGCFTKPFRINTQWFWQIADCCVFRCPAADNLMDISAKKMDASKADESMSHLIEGLLDKSSDGNAVCRPRFIFFTSNVRWMGAVPLPPLLFPSWRRIIDQFNGRLLSEWIVDRNKSRKIGQSFNWLHGGLWRVCVLGLFRNSIQHWDPAEQWTIRWISFGRIRAIVTDFAIELSPYPYRLA